MEDDHQRYGGILFFKSLHCEVEAHSALKWEAVIFCLQTGAAGVNAAAKSLIRQLIKRGRNIEPPFFKTRERSHFSQWRFAPAWFIDRNSDFQQTTTTTETPTFGLILLGTCLNLQSIEETQRQKDSSKKYWINYKFVMYNFYCSLIVVDTFVLKKILDFQEIWFNLSDTSNRFFVSICE